jgi:hypothetical protein
VLLDVDVDLRPDERVAGVRNDGHFTGQVTTSHNRYGRGLAGFVSVRNEGQDASRKARQKGKVMPKFQGHEKNDATNDEGLQKCQFRCVCPSLKHAILKKSLPFVPASAKPRPNPGTSSAYSVAASR